jgi:hypothetical protein
MIIAALDIDKEEETKTSIYFTMKQQIVINNVYIILTRDCPNNKYTDELEKDKELGEVLTHFSR